jgi:tetratricopeptide (TPR) repeat protein
MFRHFCCLFPLLITALPAEPIKVPPELFRTPEFRDRFVGSYGFLPEVEPKVDQEEARLIAELAEYLSLSRFKDAEKRLLDFIKERRNPVDPEAEAKDVSAALVFTLGNLYYQNGRANDAETAYKTAIKRFPEYRRAHKNLAMLYARSDRLKDAKPHVMKAIDLGDADHLSFGILGLALMAEEKAVEAESAFRQAALLNPEEADWTMGLVRALLLKEDWVQAASMLQTLIDKTPDDPLLWMQQANCYLQSDQVMRAAENYEVLRLKGLADEAALNTLGDIYANREQPLLALGAYLSAIQKSEVVKIDRSIKAAGYLLQLEAPDEAAKLISEVRSKAGEAFTKKQKIEALLVESDVASAKKDLSGAAGLLREALEIDQLNGSTRVKLGSIFLQQAESAAEKEATELKSQARVEFQKASLNSDKKVAYRANRELAIMFVKNQQYREALPLLEKAVRLKEGSKQAIELYLRRIQRAAELQKEREERFEADRKEKRDELAKSDEKASEEDEQDEQDEEKKEGGEEKKTPEGNQE